MTRNEVFDCCVPGVLVCVSGFSGCFEVVQAVRSVHDHVEVWVKRSEWPRGEFWAFAPDRVFLCDCEG